MRTRHNDGPAAPDILGVSSNRAREARDQASDLGGGTISLTTERATRFLFSTDDLPPEDRLAIWL
ncbi:hypothetical protein ABTK32_19475, partial [Acinetobacter baumannii]